MESLGIIHGNEVAEVKRKFWNVESTTLWPAGSVEAPYGRLYIWLYISTSYRKAHILLTVNFNKLPDRLIFNNLLTELNKVHVILGSQDFSNTGLLHPKFIFNTDKSKYKEILSLKG